MYRLWWFLTKGSSRKASMNVRLSFKILFDVAI